MFKNQKIYIKIGIGFGVVLLFLILVSFLAYTGIDDSDGGFQDYIKVNVDNNLISLINSDLTYSKVSAKKYLTTKSTEDINHFNARLKSIKENLNQINLRINDSSKKVLISKIEQAVKSFENEFASVVAVTTNEDKIFEEVLNIDGPKTTAIIESLLNDLIDRNKSELSSNVALMQEHFLLARISVLKFINSGNSDFSEAALDDIEIEVYSYIDRIERKLKGENSEQMEQIKFLLNRYTESFKEMSIFTTQRFEKVNNLDILGDEVEKSAKTLNDMITKEEEVLGKSVTENNQTTKNFVLWFSVIAFIIAVIFALIIVRAITKPLNYLVLMGKNVSEGNFSEDYDLNQKDEVGEVYQALLSIVNILKSFNIEFNILTDSVKNDNYKIRLDESNFAGGFKDILKASNSLMTILEEKIMFQISVQEKDKKVNSYQKDEVSKLKSILVKMSQGDLTGKYDVGEYDKDTMEAYNTFSEISSLVNSTISSLNEVLIQVRTASTQVQSASEQVSGASQSLSSGTTEQASSLEQISSTMQEIASQTRLNADNAGQANNLSIAAKDEAENGNKEMKNLIEAMKDINKSSRDISKIIKVIDEIAFQTNLLALNAAVEAARAGKHGKGFAVVAEEVRNLAARSAKAAKETSELIENSIKKVKQGTELVDKTGDALEKIVNGATKVRDLVAEITIASKEQTTGVLQANSALDQVSNVTQQNAANSEETAAAAEEMSSQATELENLLNKFTLSGGSAFKPNRSLPSNPNSKSNFKAIDQERRIKKIASSKSEHKLTPEDIISLDDDEFGKY
ncbi:MAG: HAMP domain-containing protein [Candidatus Delongbacteria bacterium]|nr:HAMP domain-containing protein [Candidatus Delongbacteria bacterium]MBN2834629.1 HAMP domain-containing protein [Candidatus Delongbacteria bacterium]